MMVQEPRRTRVYPEFAKMAFLVYGLIGTIAIFFVGAFIAFGVRFLPSTSAELPQLPGILWASTACLLLGSHCLYRSTKFIRREKKRPFLILLSLAFFCATAFCILQTIGMSEILHLHWQQSVQETGTAISMLLLVFLHIAHFVAGLIGLAIVTRRAFQGKYDHEYYHGIKLAALYWRFLDVIWLMMLLLFWLAS